MVNYAFNKDGNIDRPDNQALQQADETAAIIAYTDGTAADGRPFYAFIAVRPSAYRRFHELTSARQPIMLKEFGKVLASGFEAKPPAHVLQRMRDEYGYDESFIEKLKAEIVSQRKAASGQIEEKRILDIVAMLKKQQ